MSGDVGRRHSVQPDQIGEQLMDFHQRRLQLIPQSEVDGEMLRDAPIVLHEEVYIIVAHVHRRKTRLTRRDDRKAQHEAGKSVPRAVVSRCVRGEARSELVKATILKEAQHIPDEAAHIAAKFKGMRPVHPGDLISDLNDGVPVA